jgi:hypothetical protein
VLGDFGRDHGKLRSHSGGYRIDAPSLCHREQCRRVCDRIVECHGSDDYHFGNWLHRRLRLLES